MKIKTLTSLALILSVVVATVYLIPTKEIALNLIESTRSAGAIAPVLFFVAYVVAAVLGFSRTALAVVAGIVFSPVVAFAVVLVAMMASFMCTYLLAKYFLADWVASRLKKMPIARKLMSAVEENGFRMLVIMRMNPFVPGFINGYGFGLTAIRPTTYFLGSVVGSLPLTLIYLYLGWVGGEAMLRSDSHAENLQEGTMWFGAGLSVVMLIAIAWYGRRTLAMTVARNASQNDRYFE